MKEISVANGNPASLKQQQAEELIAGLVQEMTQAWRWGQRLLPEDFLRRYPGLVEHPVAVAELIYEEINLRREHGAQMPTEEILRRFPQWRSQLEVLFDCHRVLDLWPEAQFPAAGELVDDFLLLSELGRGGLGRVFLASQVSLAERPVVLKFTPREALEHLSLARLQHTHIVPLYSAHDHPERGLRSLCMPYFGGAVLSRLLETLQPKSPAQRTGQDLLDALDLSEAAAPVRTPSQSAARTSLARASYVQAVCWIGACLADGLHYAHERGFVHLDLKPSNVLLAADGQPMLLDFHLSHEPILPGEKSVSWFGGTPGYMSPEQQDALRALHESKPVERPVDQRSDVYSLGLLLFEALASRCRQEGDNGRSLRRLNPQVSVGLADLVQKCLAEDPDRRYPSAAALAADLRRHLTDRPLSCVRNRSIKERWQKWRRRRPYAVAHLGMMLAVLLATGAVAAGTAAYFADRTEQAENALRNGQAQMAQGDWQGAVRTFHDGLSAAREVRFRHELTAELSSQLRLAEQGRAKAERDRIARELHRLTDRVRFLLGPSELTSSEKLHALAPACRVFWEGRTKIVQRLSQVGDSLLEPSVREDLLDLAFLWAELQVRLASLDERAEGRRKALEVLQSAEALFGPSPVLDEERRYYGYSTPLRGKSEIRNPKSERNTNREEEKQKQGERSVSDFEDSALGVPSDFGFRISDFPPSGAWEHYALGRSFLRAGKLEQAAAELEQAVRLHPQGLWPNFYQGICAYRLGRYAEAAAAFSVCIGAAPEAASCFYNRALAFDALGQPERARLDYDQALRLDPTFADSLF